MFRRRFTGKTSVFWFRPVRLRKRGISWSRKSLPGAPGPTVVYVTLQRTAEEVAGFLTKNGLPARAPIMRE